MGNTEFSFREEGAPLLSARLTGLALTSPNVSGLAAFYGDAMAYTGGWIDGDWKGWHSSGWLRIAEGAANALSYAAFAVDDEQQLAALRSRLSAAGLPFRDVDSPDFTGSSVLVADPDENTLLFGIEGPRAAQRINDEIVARLQHVVYASRDVPPMLHFYCGIVGFAPSDYVLDESGDLTSAFLRCSEEHHTLAVFRAPANRLDHFCYDVDDWGRIRDWGDRFAKRHITIRWGPGRHGPGNNLFLFVNDPDGNWVELSAELDRVPGAARVKRWLHEERTLNSWGPAFLRS